jgi:glucose-6-phosphate isomerase
VFAHRLYEDLDAGDADGAEKIAHRLAAIGRRTACAAVGNLADGINGAEVSTDSHVPGSDGEVDAESLEDTAADAVLQRIGAEEAEMAGTAARSDSGQDRNAQAAGPLADTGIEVRCAGGFQFGFPPGSSARPPRPSATRKTIFEVLSSRMARIRSWRFMLEVYPAKTATYSMAESFFLSAGLGAAGSILAPFPWALPVGGGREHTMELPDEAISCNYQALLIPPGEEWGPVAELRAQHYLSPQRLKDLVPQLMQSRSQVAAEREVKASHPELQPLEPGFIDLPQALLDHYRRKGEASMLGKVLSLANHLKENADRLVLLGVGGAVLGGKAIFRALRSAYHNELPLEARLGVPCLYFEGDGADNDALQELLELLQVTCVDPERREERWAVVCISKSGLALEPAIALRIFRREATEYYGLRSPWHKDLFAAVTSPQSRLRRLFEAQGHSESEVLTIPDNVGERFAVFTPAGLLPTALAGLDTRALLLGAAAMTKRFLEEPFERNPVLQLAAVNYLMSEERHKPLRVLSIWSKKLAAVGPWYDHLIAESLGKVGRGPSPLSVVQTADLHSRGQHHLEGPRDRVIMNLILKNPRNVPLGVQMADHNEDDLNACARKTVSDVMTAALRTANRGYHELARPTLDILLPTLSEHTMGQLLQLLMLATVMEARLMGINPYSRPGIDAQNRQVRELLRGEHVAAEPCTSR